MSLKMKFITKYFVSIAMKYLMLPADNFKINYLYKNRFQIQTERLKCQNVGQYKILVYFRFLLIPSSIK